jgi:hypothetical protein
MGTICNKRGGLVRVNRATGIDNILLRKFELDEQWEYAKSSNPKKRLAVVGNPWVDSSILRKLSRDGDREVRIAASNKLTHLLRVCIRSEDRYELGIVA